MDKKIKKAVRSLATQIYIFNLQERMNGISLGKMQKQLLNKSSISDAIFWKKNSRRFYKNAQGICLKDHKLVDAVETQYPGTKSIFSNLLWVVLENPLADINTVHDLMHKLPPDLHSRMFKRNPETSEYTRKIWRTPSQISMIEIQNDLDALACLLLVLREMELEEKWHRYTRVKWAVNDLTLRLCNFSPIKQVSDRFYQLISRLYIQRNNPLPEEFIRCRFIPKKHYSSPYYLGGTYYYNEFISGILYNAKSRGFETTDKQSLLRFLFWVDYLGKSKCDKALKNEETSPKDKALLIELFEASRAKHFTKYFGCYYFID